MPSFTCEKCKDGTLEFEICDADSGDGVWFQSWQYAELVGQSCQCEYTEEELAKFNQAAIDASYQEIADMQVNSLLASHGF